MAKLLTDRHGHNWLEVRRHGNSKRALVRVQAIAAIVEGVSGQDEPKAAIHVGEAHPLRVSDAFDDVVAAFISKEVAP